MQLIFIFAKHSRAWQQTIMLPINTTDSYFVNVLKIEYVCKITIFGLKMMVKNSLLKFLYAGDYFSLHHKSVQNHKFSNKSKTFCDVCTYNK